jgi:predicted glycoside hydrolase/deacetylase ChbG (UPF0249 family)
VTQEQSLAECLGFSPDERLLIVTCDDFGSSHAANLGIGKAIHEGFASSTTMMVPCPWAREAAMQSAGLDVGIHLTLTAEYPGYRWRSLTNARSLHDKDGYLPRTAEEVWANALLAEVEAECRAQIEQALEWGVDVTHLDAHMGTMQTDRRYFEIYVRLAADFRLPLRMVSASHERQMGFACRVPASQFRIVFPDNFIAPRWGRPARQTLMQTITNLRPGVSEIFLHPVTDGPELRGYDLQNSDLRAADYACLMDPEVKSRADEFRVKTISFRPLRDLMRH